MTFETQAELDAMGRLFNSAQLVYWLKKQAVDNAIDIYKVFLNAGADVDNVPYISISQSLQQKGPESA